MKDYTRYILALFITIVIFMTAFALSNIISTKRVSEVKGIQDKIALDILSLETQFDLVREVSCSNVDSTVLSSEINNLADKLTFTENERGADDEQVIYLKRYYALLQIKDYLLSKRLTEKCSTKNVSVIYLYSNKPESCEKCREQGLVLTYLRENYPQLRVYAFDKDLDLSAMRTLLSIYKVQGELPALIVNEKVYYGFKTKEDMVNLFPPTLKSKAQIEQEAIDAAAKEALKNSTSTATTTATGTSKR